MAIYVDMARGNVEGTAAAIAAARAEDQDQWGIGLSLGYSGIIFGADYRADDQGTSAANRDSTDNSVGLSYAMGPWTIGAAYAHCDVEASFGLGQDNTDGYQVGAVYTLVSGATLTRSVTHWVVNDYLKAPAIDNTATVFVFGSILSL